MTNGQNVVRSRHLEELANAAKRYTLQEIFDLTEAVAAELESIGGSSITGGVSGNFATFGRLSVKFLAIQTSANSARILLHAADR